MCIRDRCYSTRSWKTATVRRACEQVRAAHVALTRHEYGKLPAAADGTALVAAGNRDAVYLQKAYDTLRATPRAVLEGLK